MFKNPIEAQIADMLALASTPPESGNFIKDLDEIKRDIIKSGMAETDAAVLSDISDDLGLITTGEIRMGNGNEPGSGFTGIRLGYPPFDYNSLDWHIVGVNNDVLQFGMSADDGAAYFAAGKGIIDSVALKFNDVMYGIQQYATYQGAYRIYKQGMWGIIQSDPASYSLEYRGDFSPNELETYTAWTAWTATDSANITWDMTGENPIATSVDGINETAYLYSDFMAVTVGSFYSAMFRFDNTKTSGTGAFTTLAYIDWYQSNKSTLISSDLIHVADTGGIFQRFKGVTAPALAAYAQLRIQVSCGIGATSSGYSNIYVNPSLTNKSKFQLGYNLINYIYQTYAKQTVSTSTTGSATANTSGGSGYLRENGTVTTSLSDSATMHLRTPAFRVSPGCDYLVGDRHNLTISSSCTVSMLTEVEWYDYDSNLISASEVAESTSAGDIYYDTLVQSPEGAFWAKIHRKLVFTSTGSSCTITADYYYQYFFTNMTNQGIYFVPKGVYIDDDTIKTMGDYNSPFVLVRDQKAQNTDGGTFTSGAWQTRTLNTASVDTHNLVVSLSSNQITLPPGTYRVIARCPARNVGLHQARLQNITSSTTLLTGSSAYSYGTNGQCDSVIYGRITLTVESALELQHRGTSTVTTTGFGQACNFTTEVYSEIMLWKE